VSAWPHESQRPSTISCPACQVTLTRQEIVDGRCDSCGHALTGAIQVGRSPRRDALAAPAKVKRVYWISLIAGLLALAGGAWFAFHTLSGGMDGPATVRSRRFKALEDGIGTVG